MLHIVTFLPTGKTTKPSKMLMLQWYYMTYHHVDHMEYIKSGKKLSTEMI